MIGIPLHNYLTLVSLAFVWIFFRFILILARLGLVESVHDSAGTDVRLYRHLRFFFIVGGIITALMVFIHQLPVVYEVMDLADRLFSAVSVCGFIISFAAMGAFTQFDSFAY